MSPTLTRSTRDKMITVATCVLLYFGSAWSQTTSVSTERPEHLSDLNHRLPDSVRPIHYDLYMNPLMGQKSFNGNVKILINVTGPVSRIVLHSKNLNVHGTKLVTAEGKVPVTIKASYPYETFEYWITELEDETPAGLYEISMEFGSSPSDDNKGFYQVSYKPKGAKDEKWVASAKFEPTYARAAYPCFDEPALKATYSIKVQHPNSEEYHALSNMDIEKVADFGNYSVTTFKKSVPMSTYLVCFVVSDFGYRSIQIEPKQFGHSFEMRVYAEKNALNRTQLALEIGKKITEFFTDYFGIPYALPKLDMIAIPDFQPSALETWGLITYRDRILFYDENDVSFQMKETSGAVIAHELAHMWFGNLVTMCWWSDIWLNEAFASFMLYKGLNHAYPEWKVDDLFIVNEVYNALKFDASPASHPIIQDATDPDSIFALFDSVTYQKGSSVLRMLENVVGPDNFQSAVTNYLKKYMFGNAETDDFVSEIARTVPHIEVKELMATWTQQMGYPVLNVMKFEDGMYVLTQKRFFSNPDNAAQKYNDSVFDYKWIIPVTYFSSEDSSCKLVWMDRTDNEVIIDVPGAEWVKFNKDHIGFYRVNYPRVMWMKFADVMMQNRSKFSTLDRSSFFGDAFSLADSSQLAYDIPLELSKSLENETDQVIWFLGGNELGKIMHLLDGEEMVAFKKFGAKIVKMAYEKVGWKVYIDDYEANYQYAILRFACRMELEDCVSRANQEFSAWMENPAMKPNPNLRSIIFETSLKSVNDTEVWNKVWERYVNEEEPHLRRTYLHALGATKTDSLLQEYLRRAENETNVRRHDYFDVVREISSSDPDLAWQYVRENWKQIVDRFGLSDPELANLIPIISNRFCTEDKLSELEQFIQQYPDAGSGVLARQKAVQQVRSNIKWRENNMDSISDWLRRNEFIIVVRGFIRMIPLRIFVLTLVLATCAVEAKKRIHLEYGAKIPDEIRPVNYDLTLFVDGAKKSHSGKVKVTFNLAGPLSYIPIHTRDLTITGVQLTQWPDHERIINNGTYYVRKHELLVFKYADVLPIGRYDLTLTFVSSFSESLAGLHKSSYYDPKTDARKWFAVSNFWPSYTRRVFPCFDELHLLATFDVTLQHETKSGYKALSNGDVEEVTVNSEVTTTSFERTKQMSPNMLSIFVSDMIYTPVVARIDDDTFEIRLYTQRSQASNLDYATDALKLIYEHLGDYFEAPFPMSKLDVVAVPGFRPNRGASAGLIFLRDTDVVFNSALDSVHDLQRISKAMANKVTHLFFDTPVKFTNWSDIWLTDSLGAFMEHRILEDIYISADYENQIIPEKQIPGLEVDASPASRPIVMPVDTLDDVYALQDDAVWKKGASLLYMLEYVVGREVFRSAIVNFLTKSSKKTQATVDDFFLEVTKAGAHFDVAGTMFTWIRQMGYPVITPVTLDSKIFQITQSRFLLNTHYNTTRFTDSVYKYKWNVPTTYFPSHNIEIFRSAARDLEVESRMGSSKKLYMDTFSLDKNIPQFTLNLPTEVGWVKFNREGTGFYRVNYPHAMWDTFAAVLDKNYALFSEADRANLISDAFALAEAGQVPYEIPFELVKYVEDDQSSIVWDTVTKAFARIIRLMKYQDSMHVIRFTQSLVDGIFNTKYFQDKGPMIQQLRKAQIARFACMNLNKICLEEVKDRFLDWYEDKEHLPPSHLREFIYYNGLRMEGDEKVWKTVWDRFVKCNDPNERQRLLNALASTTNTDRLKKMMTLAEYENYVPKQDFLPFLASISEANPHIVWGYLKKNWSKLVNRFGIDDITLGKLLLRVTSYFANEELLGNIKKFYRVYPDAGPTALLREQAIENVKNNIRWAEQSPPKIVEWLKATEEENPDQETEPAL